MSERIPSIEPQRLRALLPRFESLLRELEVIIEDKWTSGIENAATEEDIFDYLQREWVDINLLSTDEEKREVVLSDHYLQAYICMARRKLASGNG
ncbi:MAG: hypothetical protein ACK42D_00105 [Candidatus Paceibacteria bacterium]